VIRAATVDDLISIQRIANEAFEPFIVTIGKEPAPMVADFFTQITDGLVVVAEGDDGVVGYCVSYPMKSAWHVENLAISSEAQGLGIGAALMADTERRAMAAGRVIVELYTNVAMNGALSFYPRLGYDEVRRAEEDGFQRAYFSKRLS